MSRAGKKDKKIRRKLTARLLLAPLGLELFFLVISIHVGVPVPSREESP